MARVARVIVPGSRFGRILRGITDRLRPRRFRHEVEAKATALIAVHGLLAYAEAREQARMERTGQSRFWGHVAIEIARREEREVGVSGADRYLRM